MILLKGDVLYMKILVITHSSNSVYGAATSLKSLLNNADFKFDLVYLNNLTRRIDKFEMKKWAGKNCENVFGYMYSVDIRTVVKQTPKIFIKELLKKVYTWYGNFKVKKLIRQGNYDLIILNSLTLYKWIQNDIATMIIVRCMLLETTRIYYNVVKKIEHAKKVVFIGSELKYPFRNGNIKSSVILPNPINMEKVNEIDSEAVLKKYNLNIKKEIIIAILGVVNSEKGIHFAIDAFKKTNRKDIKLLIVGSGNKKYYEYCKKLSQNDDRIVWIGETEKTEEIYKITDYVLRADRFFVVGRTVYEGLFSGCGLIIQGNYNNLKMINEWELYKDRIYFYSPRNETELIKIFSCIDDKKSLSMGRSNVDSYVKSFQEYMYCKE